MRGTQAGHAPNGVLPIALRHVAVKPVQDLGRSAVVLSGRLAVATRAGTTAAAFVVVVVVTSSCATALA